MEKPNLMDKKKLEKFAKNSLLILLGNAILAFLVAAFVIPHDIIMGGTTGIGIVLNRFTGVDTALTVLALNLVLLLIGWIVLGHHFFLTTVASSLIYPIFLGLFQKIPGIDQITNDPLLASLFAGALMGLALGLVMRAGSSTGGTDVVDLILAKWFHLPVAFFVYLVDVIVIGGQALLLSTAEPLLYGILVALIEGMILDQVVIFGKAQVQVFAVSSRYEEIRRRLLLDLKAGVTMVHVETGGFREKQMAVMCVTSPRKLYRVMELITEIDPESFVSITKIREVRGAGFTRERKNLDLTVGEGLPAKEE